MELKAICTDIDGTLLNGDRDLSIKTIDVIRRVSKKIPVILASSRMPSAMRHLQAELDISDHPLVCYNGGYNCQFVNGVMRVFDSVAIDPTISQDITLLAHTLKVHASVYVDDRWYAPAMDQWAAREQTITKVSPAIVDLEFMLKSLQALHGGAHKIMCMGDPGPIKQLADELEKKYSEHIYIYFSRPTYLELASRKISKASGVQSVLEKVYGLSIQDALAFGDNYNDIDMLQAAGIGIAVANARDEVKSAAKEITLKSVEDGVAVSIEKYFGLA